jgi:hypothetical protein
MSPSLSHNLLTDLTSRPPDNEAVAFSQLRTSLIKVLRNSPEAREPICDALELIETLQQQRDVKRNPDAAPAPPARSREKETSVQDYLIQSTREGAFLTERRPSGSQPFRCPKEAYEAAAKILSQTRQPAHFEELLERLNAEMGERQADYRLRVCLRFWLSHQLVERFRTRYRAVDGDKFYQQAYECWKRLAQPL